MGNRSASQIFPLSFKTAAMANIISGGGIDAVYNSLSNPQYGVIGFQLYQPYNLYRVTKMKMHFRCSFASTVPTAQQVISKIVVGSNGNGLPSTTAPSINVNYTPTGGFIDFMIDLKSLITPTGDNIIFLFLPKTLYPGDTGWSGYYSQIQVAVWKVDMLYQVLGIR